MCLVWSYTLTLPFSPSLPPSLKMVEDGYEFFAKRQLVTLFSAPNYRGAFDNAGAIMSVDETLMCSFQVCRVTSLHTWPDCGLDIPGSEASTGQTENLPIWSRGRKSTQ